MHRFTLSALFLLSLVCAPSSGWADSRAEIEEASREALERLLQHAPEAASLLQRAAGVLVFPDLVKVGFGAGGEYGEGALFVDDEAVAYYATAGASFGLQLGAQYKSEVILFMELQALNEFRNSRGWEAGVDAGVVLADVGGGESVDKLTAQDAVVAIVFSNTGLMYHLTLEGSKISRIAR